MVADVAYHDKSDGNPHAPQIHLGPAVCAMEKKGIRTDQGELNRQIVSANTLFDTIRNTIRKLQNWLAEFLEKISAHEIVEEPEGQNLAEILSAYLTIRKEGRTDCFGNLHPSCRLNERNSAPSRPH